jgi:hypothetical protein
MSRKPVVPAPSAATDWFGEKTQNRKALRLAQVAHFLHVILVFVN